jgi:hypothetical protein
MRYADSRPGTWILGAALVFASCMAWPLVSAQSGITVEGITDRAYDLYNDHVSFRVPAASGWTYRVELDGQRMPTDLWMEVNRVGFHEVEVWRSNLLSKEAESRKVRFILQSSERSASGSTENGLPAWTPYPLINSSTNEFVGAHLEVVAPKAYPLGMEIPVVAWVRKDSQNPVRANGPLTAAGHPSIQIRRGVGSGFLATNHSPGILDYRCQLGGLEAVKSITVEDRTDWTQVAGELTGEVIWPDNARISVSGNLTIPPGSKLIVGAGVVVQLQSKVNIYVDGSVQIEGSDEQPVVFAPVNRAQPWGGFFLRASTSQLDARSAIFTGSGADPQGGAGHRSEQCLFYLENHAGLSLTDCAAIDLVGQFGHGVDSGQPWNRIVITRSLIQRCITGGEWNGSSFRFLNSALIEVPYATPVFANRDEDGIYFTTGEFEVRDSLIGWTRDDGIDSGSGGSGSVTVSNTWIEATYHEAFAWSGGGRTTTNLNTVSLNCGQGIECGWSSTANSPLDFVDHCLSIGNAVGARFGDNYDWTFNGFLRITNSLLLNNGRDVWGMSWQTDSQGWIYRTNQMDIRGNFLTAAHPQHPTNEAWNPALDGWRLGAFMTTPPDASVGLGFAVWTNQFDLPSLFQGVPVGLSSFTTNPVTVEYVFESATGRLSDGALTFSPGEVVKRIYPLGFDLSREETVRLLLSNPGSAELTGITEVGFSGTVPSPQVSCLVGSSQTDLARLGEGIALALSAPSSEPVLVKYVWELPGSTPQKGEVVFSPGERIQWLASPSFDSATAGLVRLSLTDASSASMGNPINHYWVKTPFHAASNQILLPAGALWRYLDTGTNLGLAWSPANPNGWTGVSFDDGKWLADPAPLGYGNGGAEATTNSYGGVSSDKFITYYFRRGWIVTNLSRIKSLTFNLLRDDGAVVYLNGSEVYRENMPSGTITNLSLASTNVGGTANAYYARELSVHTLPQPLRDGTNVVAIEIHQSSKSSSDILLDFQVQANLITESGTEGSEMYVGKFGEEIVVGWGDVDAQLLQSTNVAGPWEILSTQSPLQIKPTLSESFFRLSTP